MSIESQIDSISRKTPPPNARLDKYVRRYTSISSALDTLMNRRLVLLDPSTWDDTNDSYFIDLYQTASATESMLALCCTRATETYHHWKVFTEGKEGLCIEIKRDFLQQYVDRHDYLVARDVEYLFVKDVEEFGQADLPRLPFVKRKGFEDEREWRIIGTSSQSAQKALPIRIELSWINRVVVNPWMPPSLAETLRMLIHNIRGCEKMRVESSRLTNSLSWKNAGEKVAGIK